MKLHKFKNYKQYVKIQTKKNKRRIDATWALPEEMAAVAKHVKEHIPGASFGICHGAKHGWEVQQLRDHLGIEVIGTDISDSAADFDHVIQWDFHEVKDEWLGKTSFIYSNSFDHSFDPPLALERWMSCLTDDGLCYLEWTEWDSEENSTPDDPFGASLDEYRALVTKKFALVDEIFIPKNDEAEYGIERVILVVRRTPL